jgi:hypothetical protein
MHIYMYVFICIQIIDETRFVKADTENIPNLSVELKFIYTYLYIFIFNFK